jgi:YidC/Oxa1 family membrane protein insertase
MWDLLILNPMINSLIWLYGLLGRNYLLAILIFTGVTRLILWPLTMQQQKSSSAMQQLQPKLKELQAKYKDDQETLSRKTMEIYREHNINPVMGCLPMLIQFPILIGLYQALSASLASSPLALITLSQHIYHPVPEWLRWLPDAASLIPLNSRFGWLDLSRPDPLFILPVLVVVTTWLQNKLLTPPNPDPQQASMNMSMQLMMPLMIGWFSLNFPSGLSIYWVVANVIGVAQYAAMGKAALKNIFGTADGSFSWRGLLGLPQPEPVKSGRRKR